MSNYIWTSEEGKEISQIVEHDIPPHQQFPIIQQPLLFHILLLVCLISTPCPARRSRSIAVTRFRLSPRTILAQTHSTCGVHDLAHLRRKSDKKSELLQFEIKKHTKGYAKFMPSRFSSSPTADPDDPENIKYTIPMRLARRKSMRSLSSAFPDEDVCVSHTPNACCERAKKKAGFSEGIEP
jgi:hypothetical protein